MSELCSSMQCFLVTIVIFALVGFARGSKREMVSMCFTVATVLTLALGGGEGLADFFLVRLPLLLQVAAGAKVTIPTGNANVSATNVFTTTIIVLVVGVGSGYLIGNRVFPLPAAAHERLWAIIPALISGFFFLVYVTQLLSAPMVSLVVSLPAKGDIAGYIPLVIIIIVVAVLAALFAGSVSVKKPVKKP